MNFQFTIEASLRVRGDCFLTRIHVVARHSNEIEVSLQQFCTEILIKPDQSLLFLLQHKEIVQLLSPIS